VSALFIGTSDKRFSIKNNNHYNNTTPDCFSPLTLGDRLAPVLNLSHPELMLVFCLLSPLLGETTVEDFRQGQPRK
jgi:hypothetical protein